MRRFLSRDIRSLPNTAGSTNHDSRLSANLRAMILSAASYRKHGMLGLSSAHSSEKNWNSCIEGFQELLGELVR